MRGYNTLKQFSKDYWLYKTAKEMDPGREEGETITSILKKRIDDRLKNATKQFRNMLKKRNYSKLDLVLIAVHDNSGRTEDFEKFIKECFDTEVASFEHYKKVLASNAFRTGRLKKIYNFIPYMIETKRDFEIFIKMKHGIPKQELSVIMNYICKDKWKRWLHELMEQDKLVCRNGRYYI